MNELDSLKNLLSIDGNGDSIAQKLLTRYVNFNNLCEATVEELTDLTSSQSTAIYIKAVAAIAGRTVTDRFKNGRKYTDAEIGEYFKGLFFGRSIEFIAALSFDKDGRLIASDMLADGIVNYSTLVPRKLLETAYKRGAHSVIIAHNHPGGHAKASELDLTATAGLSSVLNSSKIKLTAHYIISGNEYEILYCNK